MKKLMLALAALAVTTPAFAAWSESIFRDNAVQVVYTSPAVTGSTAAIVVDLSNTTNWPHKNTGSIDISGIWVDFDRTGTSTSTVKIGVLTSVDASSGNVTYFWIAGNTVNHVATQGPVSPNLGSLLRTEVTSDGVTPFILSNNKHTASAIYKTTITLPTPNGTFVAPAAGDIVVYIEGSAAAAITATVHLLYTSER